MNDSVRFRLIWYIGTDKDILFLQIFTKIKMLHCIFYGICQCLYNIHTLSMKSNENLAIVYAQIALIKHNIPIFVLCDRDSDTTDCIFYLNKNFRLFIRYKPFFWYFIKRTFLLWSESILQMIAKQLSSFRLTVHFV